MHYADSIFYQGTPPPCMTSIITITCIQCILTNSLQQPEWYCDCCIRMFCHQVNFANGDCCIRIYNCAIIYTSLLQIDFKNLKFIFLLLYSTKDELTTVSMRGVRTEADVTNQQKIWKEFTELLHCQHCRIALNICCCPTVILS